MSTLDSLSINLSGGDGLGSFFSPKLVVFGIGGAGCNAVNRMAASGSYDDIDNVVMVLANTDAQVLARSDIKNKIQLGPKVTRGLGAGSDPEKGRLAAEEVETEIIKYLEDADMIFITAGMGGGTGTGAAPVVARLAKERDILSVAVVTKPFQMEQNNRMKIAESGLVELEEYVDAIVVIPNQKVFRVVNPDTKLSDAFKQIDEVLLRGVESVINLIKKTGIINLDFADVKNSIKGMGRTVMGTGIASGENRAEKAIGEAMSNPLLEDTSIEDAKGIIVNITASSDMTLFEFEEAVNKVSERANPTAKITIGTVLDESMGSNMMVLILAAGVGGSVDISKQNKLAENRQKVVAQKDDIMLADLQNKDVLHSAYEKKINMDYGAVYQSQLNKPQMDLLFDHDADSDKIACTTYDIKNPSDVLSMQEHTIPYDINSKRNSNDKTQSMKVKAQSQFSDIDCSSDNKHEILSDKRNKQEKKKGLLDKIWEFGKNVVNDQVEANDSDKNLSNLNTMNKLKNYSNIKITIEDDEEGSSFNNAYKVV